MIIRNHALHLNLKTSFSRTKTVRAQGIFQWQSSILSPNFFGRCTRFPIVTSLLWFGCSIHSVPRGQPYGIKRASQRERTVYVRDARFRQHRTTLVQCHPSKGVGFLFMFAFSLGFGLSSWLPLVHEHLNGIDIRFWKLDNLGEVSSPVLTSSAPSHNRTK